MVEKGPESIDGSLILDLNGDKMQKSTVDIIILTYKPQKRLTKVIELLENQTYSINKIIIMNTEEKYWNTFLYGEKLLKVWDNVEVHHLSKMEFDHGATRKQAVKRSKADYFICMTDDAVPADENLVEELLKPLLEKKAEFSYARQLPNEDCAVIERFTRDFNYPAESCIKSKEDLERLQIKTYFFSNVCAAYRKSVYDTLGGFVRNTIFNEDMLMSASMIQAEYHIAYVAEAKVYHSHNYSYKEQFKRNFDLAVSQKEYADVFDSVPSESEGIKMVLSTTKKLLKSGRFYLIPDLFLQSAFKYLGYRKGKKFDTLSHDKIMKYTMNKSYWN